VYSVILNPSAKDRVVTQPLPGGRKEIKTDKEQNGHPGQRSAETGETWRLSRPGSIAGKVMKRLL